MDSNKCNMSWYTPEQVEALERVYAECPKPSSMTRQQLIRKYPILSDIELQHIKLWFQNRRMEESLLQSEATDIKSIKGKVWVESKKLWRISLPAIISSVASMAIVMVTQAFIGHTSELSLAAYALTQTLSLQFVNGILLGMTSATETLCGQAFGAKQYHMLGIYLQRSWIIIFCTATILLPVFIFTEQIFKAIGQKDNIAVEAGNISLWFIPVVYSIVFGYTIDQFLRAQLKNMIVMWLAVSTFLLHLLLSWIFVIKLNLGIPGAMGALNISFWIRLFGEVVYVFGGWCPNTWKGFNKAAFTDLLPVLKLSISSGLMLCLELWYNSAVVLVAGYMKNAVLAISAFSICLGMSTLNLMICLGFQIGASVRVAIELGRGDAKAAKFSIKIILCSSAIVGVFFSILCLVFGNKIGYLFTSNEDIVESISSLSILLAFTILLNGVQAVLSGVAVGSGRQSMVAYVNIGSYYVIGVPIGILLAYVAHLQVRGIWIGMMSGVAVQTAVLGYITWTTDWDEQVQTTSERLNKLFLKPSEEHDQTTNQDIE